MVPKFSHAVKSIPFHPHNVSSPSPSQDCLPLMGVAEMQWYMKALFEALRKVHSHSIIHRDIKPSNFLYNRATRRWGVNGHSFSIRLFRYNEFMRPIMHGNIKGV